ncbi:N-formylglutamate deformylase [Kordiimonas sediminis]|uniref:N-formylglutamate deformylase n=2 Tax=Kordiimonas sediminis TaxID=1735581 RepID=A0A919AYD5_9PROT|nr:N-formylglutamate deformylase [Kordiimonas sediminis]
MAPAAQILADTDWHLQQLYDFLPKIGATVLQANYSRYVIDLNRDPSGVSLYPGQSVTELCPTSTFDHMPLYRKGSEPDDAEIAKRTEAYWHPYHTALKEQLARIKGKYGYALLWDAHSIRSEVPRFFEGQLPDINLGTNSGQSCAVDLLAAVVGAFSRASNSYSMVQNERFKGGYITRTYGDPEKGVHAIQLELSQRTYMSEKPPFEYDAARAQNVKPVIQSAMENFILAATQSS